MTRPPTGWKRQYIDSSHLTTPRVLLRHLVAKDTLDNTAAYYEHLLDGHRDVHMPIPQWNGLEIIIISNVILIASDVAFTPTQRSTLLSAVVADAAVYTARPGVRIIPGHGLEPIPPGTRARCDFGHGVIVEAVEHRPLAGETPRPPRRRPSRKIQLAITTPPAAHYGLVTALAHAHQLPRLHSATATTSSVGDIVVSSDAANTTATVANPTGQQGHSPLTQICGGIGTATVVPRCPQLHR